MTPLHIGVLAPINHLAPDKVSAVSFLLTQVLLDAGTIWFYLTGHGGVDHSSHTLYVALIFGASVGLLGFWSARWVWGSFIGTFSHVLLDALVHTDVYPIAPWLHGNPMYLAAMEPLSLLLLGLSAWWLLQKTSAYMKWVALHGMPVQFDIWTSTERIKTGLDRFFSITTFRQARRSLGCAICLLAILMLPLLPI